jgi:transposase
MQGGLVMANASVLEISENDRTYFESLARSRTIQAQAAQRARVILLKAEGVPISAIAEKAGISRKSVMLCVGKYKAGGAENALFDAPGRGRNPDITGEEKAWIINTACQRPYEWGHSQETWTYTRLASYINKNAETQGYARLSTISRSGIKNILDHAQIKPHKIRYYCEKRDPDFDRKTHDVLVVCKQIELQLTYNSPFRPGVKKPTPCHMMKNPAYRRLPMRRRTGCPQLQTGAGRGTGNMPGSGLCLC